MLLSLVWLVQVPIWCGFLGNPFIGLVYFIAGVLYFIRAIQTL